MVLSVAIFFTELYGQSNREAMQIDQIFDTLLDVFIAFFAIIFSGDDETKKVSLVRTS